MDNLELENIIAWAKLFSKFESTGDIKPLVTALRSGTPSVVIFASKLLADLLDPNLPKARRGNYLTSIKRTGRGKPTTLADDLILYQYGVKFAGIDGKLSKEALDQLVEHCVKRNISREAVRKAYERGREQSNLFAT
jgi:hypothetical protein